MRILGLAAFASLFVSAQSGAAPVSLLEGPCDASAAVALDSDHFVVGSDESNTLHVYRRGQAQALSTLDLSTFLGTAVDEESDIEGAASVGSRIYWITSHGRNSKGKARPSRQRFFATDVIAASAGRPPGLKPAGTPYAKLLDDMAHAEALKPYKLRDASRLAPEAEGGLNIEGLAAMADGSLLIGLRNPLFQRRALVIPLQNPSEVLEGAQARFGRAIELDLGGRGIRSIEWIGARYLIVAGPTGDSGDFVLYGWSGKAGDAATRVTEMDFLGIRPEAVFATSPAGGVQFLSDDGGLTSAGVACKKQAPALQKFRSLQMPEIKGVDRPK